MKGGTRFGVALAAIALVVSAATLAMSIWNTTVRPHRHPLPALQSTAATSSGSGCGNCGSEPQGTDIGVQLTEAEVRLAHLRDELEPRNKIAPDEALLYYETVHGFDDIVVSRWALAYVADRLATGRFAPDSRATLEQAVSDALDSPDWRLRRAAMNAAIKAGMLNNPQVASSIRALRRDEHPEVAEHAKMITLPGEPQPTPAAPLQSDGRRQGTP
ncbi:MAG: hypothetical protein KF838_13905 [Phycisphaeraceae bacterium]|nr:MAG: hypothetical protein KF838_13905 [Phycisphaeraceae bacterium]